MSLVTIILPTFNSEKNICIAIDSILKQTFTDFELLIIDDGSNDGTANKIMKYKDERIKYHFQENAGQGMARNMGLKLASGQYIAFIDSDDYMDRFFLETMVKKINKYNADMIECNYRITQGNITRLVRIYNDDLYNYDTDELLFNYFKKGLKIPNSTYPVWNKLFRSEIIKKNKLVFSKDSYNEDYLFNFTYLLSSDSHIGIDYDGYNYIRENNSATKSKLSPVDEALVINAKKVLNLCIEKKLNKKIIKMAEVRYVHSFFSLYTKAYRYGCDIDSKSLLKEIKKQMNSGLSTILLSNIPLKRKLSIFGMFFLKKIIRIEIK